MFCKITTIFIDIDDTLWWFTENSKTAMRLTYDHFGGDTWSPGYDVFHEAYLEINHRLWHEYHHGLIGRDFLMTERFAATLRAVNYAGDIPTLARQLNDHYLDVLATLPLIVPGARELLEHLHARGYQVNALSNGFAGVQEKKLRSGGIDHLVDRVILSDHCGITKPQRGIFDYALAQCGITADQALMIGDDPDTDIAGAHAAGWQTIYFNPGGTKPASEVADAQVTSLHDVIGLL